MSDKSIDLDAIEKRANAATQECPLDQWWDDGNECISTRPLESSAAATFILAAPVDVDTLLNAVRDRDAEIAIYVEHYEAHAAWKATFTAEWQQARPAALDANRTAFERWERAEAALDAHRAKASQ